MYVLPFMLPLLLMLLRRSSGTQMCDVKIKIIFVVECSSSSKQAKKRQTFQLSCMVWQLFSKFNPKCAYVCVSLCICVCVLKLNQTSFDDDKTTFIFSCPESHLPMAYSISWVAALQLSVSACNDWNSLRFPKIVFDVCVLHRRRWWNRSQLMLLFCIQ